LIEKGGKLPLWSMTHIIMMALQFTENI
jgi:hypothetical protein